VGGGERKRLSLFYTIWNMTKRDKEVLILDEPEQGLDEDIRVKIIQNIFTLNKTMMLVYHGSKLDLLSLKFTKVWEFKRDSVNTRKNYVRKYTKSVMLYDHI
jgi:ATPase subunit of ABC transporter with duplicated ATPase domains